MTDDLKNNAIREISSKSLSFTYELSIEDYRGLEFIKKYQQYPQIADIPLKAASRYLIEEGNALETLISKKTFYRELENVNEQSIPIPITPKKTQFLEPYITKMKSDCNFTPTQSVDLALEFFIQSFVDSYNNCYDNSLTLPFIPFEDVKKRAMKNNEQDLLTILNSRENYIRGFNAFGPLSCSYNELEKIVKYNG